MIPKFLEADSNSDDLPKVNPDYIKIETEIENRKNPNYKQWEPKKVLNPKYKIFD